MNADILKFARPIKRDADGVEIVPPATCERKIYVIFWRPSRRYARCRWLVIVQFGDCSFQEIECSTKIDDWAGAMFRARLERRKLGFPITDLGVPQ